MSNLHFETASASRQGDRRINQDRCAVVRDGDNVLLVVADGMGGHPKGEQAAQILVDTCCDAFRRAAKPIREPRDFIQETLENSHANILQYARQFSPPIDPRTTAVLLLVAGTTAVWAHVGDSRLYLFHGSEPLLHTEDHSYVRELFREGRLPEQECDAHPLRNYVTRSVGGIDEAELVPTLAGPRELHPGDIVLLCSDGLWGALSVARIGEWLTDPELKFPIALERMVAEAENAAHPSSDNVTAVALRCA